MLDVTTGTNAFDGYVYTYPWKGELAPYFADLEALVPTIESAPSLGLDDYPGDVIDAYGRVDGKLIGLPILGDATMMVWNRAQYEKAGLDPAAAPGTWEDVAANGQKLKAAGLNGFGLPGGKGWQVAIMWIILFTKYGGQYFGPNYAPQPRWTCGRPRSSTWRIGCASCSRRDPALVNAKGGDGKRPLHYARTVEIAEFLLDRGAEIDALDDDHSSTPGAASHRRQRGGV